MPLQVGRSILDVQPTELHERTPLFIGNRSLVSRAEHFIQMEKANM